MLGCFSVSITFRITEQGSASGRRLSQMSNLVAKKKTAGQPPNFFDFWIADIGIFQEEKMT